MSYLTCSFLPNNCPKPSGKVSINTHDCGKLACGYVCCYYSLSHLQRSQVCSPLRQMLCPSKSSSLEPLVSDMGQVGILDTLIPQNALCSH